MNSSHLLATVNLVLGGLVFLLGFVILRENPRQRLNRVVSLMLFFGGFGAVLAALSLLVPGKADTAGLQSNVAYVWELFFPTAFLLASIFPEERGFARPFTLPGGMRSPSFVLLVYSPHAFHFLLVVALSLLPAEHVAHSGSGFGRSLADLVSVIGRLFLSVHQALFSLVDLFFGSAAVALLVGSLRRTQVRRVRQQLGAITVGLVSCLVLYAFATTIPTLLGRPLERGMQAALTTAALTLGSGAIAYSMVRHKFLDTKLIARRGILYALASALLIGFYLTVVEQVNHAVAAAFRIDARIVEPVFLIIALTLFQPAVAKLEESLDRVFLRDPNDYRNVLRALGRELQTTIDLEDLLNRSVRTLTEALLLRAAYMVAITADGPIMRTGAGEPLSQESLDGVAGLMGRLSTQEPSFRLSDPVDGLRRIDRELLVRKLGIELMVPLRWRNETLGIVLLGEKLTGTEFTSEDVALLNSLGSQMGVSLQNALLLRDRLRVARIEEELSLAHQIQQTFLSGDFPALPRCQVHAVNLPSRQVGGDYYDVVQVPDGSFLVAIADVAGKGVPAALLSSMLQAALRTQARSVESPASILRNINELVYRSTAVHQFATFFLARVSAGGDRMTYANAGHNWPVLLRRDGERQWLKCGGTILGIMEDVAMEEASVDLRAGDLLVFYTDGISEATNVDGELYGEEHLVEFVAGLPPGLNPEAISASILREIERHLGRLEAQDDRTLVVLRVDDTSRDTLDPGPLGEEVAALEPHATAQTTAPHHRVHALLHRPASAYL
ncbi:MAG TPA: SpoIIE family protein phosphatase [Candidatus Eisenbacteria bacterium]